MTTKEIHKEIRKNNAESCIVKDGEIIKFFNSYNEYVAYLDSLEVGEIEELKTYSINC